MASLSNGDQKGGDAIEPHPERRGYSGPVRGCWAPPLRHARVAALGVGSWAQSTMTTGFDYRNPDEVVGCDPD